MLKTLRGSRLRMILLLAVIAIPIQHALATDYAWTGLGGDDGWSNPLNWSPEGVPDTGDTSSIPSTASVNAFGVNADTLTNAGTVTFNSSGLGLYGTINNSGVIQSDGNSNGSGLIFYSNYDAVFTGGGSILLNNPNDTLTAYWSPLITNQDNLIHGSGVINAELNNGGIISADSTGNTLEFFSNETCFNSGIIQAINGGILLVEAPISGGTLTTSKGGVIECGGATLTNVTNNGAIDSVALPYSLATGVSLVGTINNTGVIESGSSLGPIYSSATYGQITTLTGGGTVLLDGGAIGGAFINEDNLIHGYGTVGVLTNNSTISADSNGNTLAFYGSTQAINYGTLQAVGGGVLTMGGSCNFINTNGVILADGAGSIVDVLQGCEIFGGTVKATNGGEILGDGGVISDVTTDGTVLFGSSFKIGGTINNLGVIEPDPSGTLYWDSLYPVLGQTTTFTGGGSIWLNFSEAQVLSNGGFGFINQDNLIHGFGDFQAPIVNYGTISADSSGNTLLFEGAVSNFGTLKATDGGTLQLAAGVLTNLSGTTLTGGGIYEADANSTIDLPGSITNNDATVILNGNGSAFSAINAISTNSGSFQVLGGRNFTTAGSLSNSGTVSVGSGSSLNVNGNYIQTTGVTTVEGSLAINGGSLTITGGDLDITDSKVLVNYGVDNPTPVGSIGAYIASGYNGGAWNGVGIVSSKVASVNAMLGNSHAYAVGYADASDPAVAADGFTPGTVVIEPALVGDANLDGKVNFADFQLLAASFNQPNTSWDEGDFNYAGKTNFTDFQLLAANFNESTSLDNAEFDAMNAIALSQGQTLVANPDGDGFSFVAIPEPASVGLLGMAGVGFLARRRRRVWAGISRMLLARERLRSVNRANHLFIEPTGYLC